MSPKGKTKSRNAAVTMQMVVQEKDANERKTAARWHKYDMAHGYFSDNERHLKTQVAAIS